MTLTEVKKRLKDADIPDYDYDARELFLAFSGLSLREAQCGADSDSRELKAALERRLNREPLQYILGEVGFYREIYSVNEAVLIPRPDTEHLVDYAVKNLPSGSAVLDVCSGSGCVGISTVKNTRDTRATLVDISEAALSVADENARKNGVSDRIDYIHMDIMSDFPDGKYYAVLSNPPYVSDEVYPTLASEIMHEPKIAFVGGADGGDFYRRILPLAIESIEDGGFVAFEIGYDQRELMLGLASEYSLDLEIIKDYAALDRVAVFRKNNCPSA